MKLSIIIVSYNVSSYLRQCLLSIYQSNQFGSFEVIVIDNYVIVIEICVIVIGNCVIVIGDCVIVIVNCVIDIDDCVIVTFFCEILQGIILQQHNFATEPESEFLQSPRVAIMPTLQ